MRTVLLVLVLSAAAAILAGVVAAALGRGGEMAAFPGDFAPLDQRGLGPADLASARLPMSLWGYHADAVDDLLRTAALSMAERDGRIAALRREVAELLAAQPPTGGQHPVSAGTPGVLSAEPQAGAERGPQGRGGPPPRLGDAGSPRFDLP